MTKILQLHVRGGHNSLVLEHTVSDLRLLLWEREPGYYMHQVSGNPPFIHVFLPWYTM